MNRTVAALICYLLLAGLAPVFLSGNVRLALWIFLGGLAAKTCIAHWRDRMEVHEGTMQSTRHDGLSKDPANPPHL